MNNVVASSQTISYADQVLGMWSGDFGQEAKSRLNAVHTALTDAMTAEEKSQIIADRQKHREEAEATGGTVFGRDDDPLSYEYVIHEAERRGLCTAEEAEYLRNEFISDSGLPLVL